MLPKYRVRNSNDTSICHGDAAAVIIYLDEQYHGQEWNVEDEVGNNYDPDEFIELFSDEEL